MAYQTPTSKAEGFAVNKRTWNQDVVANPLALYNRPVCIAHHSTTQSIPDGTQTMLKFDTALFDNSGLHTASGGNYSFTIPSTGVYHVGGNISLNADTQVIFSIQTLALVGAAALAIDEQSIGATTRSIALIVDTLHYFTAGEQAVFVVYQNSGGSVTIKRTASQTPRFWIYKVGDGGDGS